MTLATYHRHRKSRRPACLALAALIGMTAACADELPLDAARARGAEPALAPFYSTAAGTEVVPGAYLVQFRKGIAEPERLAADLVRAAGGSLRSVFRQEPTGFSAELSPGSLALIRQYPDVEFVEEVKVLRVTGVQTNAPWHLDRIDQRFLPRNGTYIWNTSGKGVSIYVLDTGIHVEHGEFGGRARHGASFATGGTGDCYPNGHGTHVASVAAGRNVGVAKEAAVVSVKVADCDGNVAEDAAILGIAWVTQHHVKPAVANISFGFNRLTTDVSNAWLGMLERTIEQSIAAGVTFVIAAGNSGIDACDVTPARLVLAVTVAATDAEDRRAVWSNADRSNHGPCVDLFAPGTNILVATPNGGYVQGAYGTSVAAPTVAGIAALFLEAQPRATPATVSRALIGSSTLGQIGDARGAPNRLAYSFVRGPVAAELLADGRARVSPELLAGLSAAGPLYIASDGNGWLWHFTHEGPYTGLRPAAINRLQRSSDGWYTTARPVAGEYFSIVQLNGASRAWAQFGDKSGWEGVDIARDGRSLALRLPRAAYPNATYHAWITACAREDGTRYLRMHRAVLPVDADQLQEPWLLVGDWNNWQRSTGRRADVFDAEGQWFRISGLSGRMNIVARSTRGTDVWARFDPIGRGELEGYRHPLTTRNPDGTVAVNIAAAMQFPRCN